MKICPNCSFKMSDDSSFCTQCGTLMKNVIPVAEDPAPTTAENAPAPTAAENASAPQNVFAPQGSYIPQGAPAPQYTYAQQPGYTQPNGYAQQPNYSQPNGYAQQPNYTQPNGYAQQPNYTQQPGYAYTRAPKHPKNEFDHTLDYKAEDISENKVLAILIYLTGVLGILLAVFIARDSEYVKFHIREGLKLFAAEVIVSFAAAILCWTIIVPIVGGIALIALMVIAVICFVRVCMDEVREVPIICKLRFLR